MDQNPVDEKPFDKDNAKSLANQKILFLASDSLRSNIKGVTPDETHIEDNLEKIAQKAKGSIFFTAISSSTAFCSC